MTHAMAIAPTSIPHRRLPSGRAFVSALRAAHCAQLIAEGFLHYDLAFREITRRAPERFQLCDWQGSQLDEAERIELYQRHVERVAAEIRAWCAEQVQQAAFWQDVMRHFSILADGIADEEICHAFCRSVLVHLYRTTEGAFVPVLSGADRKPVSTGWFAAVRRFTQRASLESLIGQMLQAVPMEAEWRDLSCSTGQVVRTLRDRQALLDTVGGLHGVEMVDAVFYRFTRAYVIASAKGTAGQIIFALELKNSDDGVSVENVLLGEAEVNRLFVFTGACFHVELDHPLDTALHLQSMLPRVAVGDFLTLVGRPSRASIALAG
jgi:isocitrate dehydrogenase kinase/phosphatase